MAAAIASIGGGILSIFGLIYSYRAAKRAQAATDAAREAREAVRRSNAGEELRALSEMAKELLRSVQVGSSRLPSLEALISWPVSRKPGIDGERSFWAIVLRESTE
jgi:hypothetical protein